jgi:hypothetical protein
MEREYSTYLFEYFHNDSYWNFRIKAASEEDALERLKRIPYARLLGTVQGSVPAGMGFIARLACWWKNLHLFEKKT